MTPQEFEDSVRDMDSLVEVCSDHDISWVTNQYVRSDDLDGYLQEELINRWRTAIYWPQVRDMLNEVPEGCVWYHVDGMDICDADDDYDRLRGEVYEYMTENGYFDEDEDVVELEFLEDEGTVYDDNIPDISANILRLQADMFGSNVLQPLVASAIS